MEACQAGVESAFSQSTVTQQFRVFVADLLIQCDWHHKTWLLDPNARHWSVLCADVDSNTKAQYQCSVEGATRRPPCISAFKFSFTLAPHNPTSYPFLNSFTHHAITPIVAIAFIIVVITSRNELGCNRFSGRGREADRVASTRLPRGRSR